jgi:hypothetical protein
VDAPILRTTTEKVAGGDPFIAAAARKGQRSSRHHRCDYEFLELLESDFGIPQFSLRQAFMGVPPAPMRQAIALCGWAIRTSGGDVDEAGDDLRAWAKKHEVGQYDPRLLDAPADEDEDL